MRYAVMLGPDGKPNLILNLDDISTVVPVGPDVVRVTMRNGTQVNELHGVSIDSIEYAMARAGDGVRFTLAPGVRTDNAQRPMPGPGSESAT